MDLQINYEITRTNTATHGSGLVHYPPGQVLASVTAARADFTSLRESPLISSRGGCLDT